MGPLASRAVSPPGCTGSGLGINLFTDIGDVHIGDTIHYSASIFNGLSGSLQVACDATSILAGIVTPDGLTNMITLRRTTLLNGQADFYTNVVSYVVRAQDIQPDGTLKTTAFDNGDIHQNAVPSRGGGFQGVNTQVNQPCVQITAQCVSSVGELGLITFTGSVTNCGNNTLVGVTITNFVNNGSSTVLFPTNLARGEVATFSGSWVPANACLPSTATLFVRASDEFTATPRTLTNSVSITCQNVVTPRIAVTQSCPPNPTSVGGLLTYTGTVANTGDVVLTNVVVLNDHTGSTPVFTIAALAPGIVAAFSGSYTVPADGACFTTSTVTANGNGRCSGTLVSATASATCPLLTRPAIKVTQVCPPTPTPEGGTLTFTGTVQNTGNITLTNVVVFNDRSGTTPVFSTASLAPGASATFTGSYTVPLDCCTASSTVTASGKDICTGAVVTDTSTSTCPVLTSPKIVVTKVCPTTSLEPGQLLRYSGTVSNAGNISLIDVTVVNNLSGDTAPVVGPITLAPGETISFVSSYVVPPDFCGIDTVTARGVDDCTRLAVTDSVTTICPIITSPRIAVTQRCPPDPTPRGGLHVFTGTVSNPGNVTLTNVFVVSSQPAPDTAVVGPITLAPGAAVDFTGSYTAPEACCEILNTLTASGADRCAGTTVTATSSVLCPLLSTPLIAVTRVCPVGTVPVGGLFVFTGTVRNAGDVYLTNVFVNSSQPAALLNWSKGTTGGGASLASLSSPNGASRLQATLAAWQSCQGPNLGRSAGSLAGNNTTLLGPIELAPGESKGFSGSYIVAANSTPLTDTVTARGMDTCQARTVTATADCSGTAPQSNVTPRIIFQDDTGFLGAWLMSGVDMQSAAFLTPDNTGDLDWSIVGSGDFNLDGQMDLLFQHTDGTLAVWFMNGNSLTPPAKLLNPAKPNDLAFRAVATGDFNRDGRPDILLQHTDSTLAVWLMNEVNLQSGVVITPTPGLDWKAVGTADLKGDGNLEIIFQKADGSLAVWFMNGLNMVTTESLDPSTPGDAGWHVVGTLDLNQDGKTDLLFQNSGDGALSVWYMNGIHLTEGLALNPAMPNGTWKVVAPK
jgi:uncharacterized repeat protein (TIGR01451 family)